MAEQFSDLHVTGPLTVDGNVGIGTTKPNRFNSNVHKVLTIENPSPLRSSIIELLGNADNKDDVSLGAIYFGDLSNAEGNQHQALIAVDSKGASNAKGGRMEFWTRQDNHGFDRRMVIADTGNVGIGTPIPHYPLHVTTENPNEWQARFANGPTNVYLSHAGGYGLGIDTGQNNRSDKWALDVRNAQRVHLHVRDDGNVGIGTPAPSDALHVSGAIRTTDHLKVGSGNPLTGDSDWGIDSTMDTSPRKRRAYVINHHFGLSLSAHSYYGGIRFFNQRAGSPYPYNGTMVMAITNGRVGIGTTKPSQELQVIGQAGFFDGVSHRGVTINPGLRDGIADIYSDYVGGSEPKLHVSTYSQRATANGITVDTVGNVGIGTASPAGKLHVHGAAAGPSANSFLLTRDGDAPFMRFQGAGGRLAEIQFDGSVLNIQNGSNHPIERMVLNARQVESGKIIANEIQVMGFIVSADRVFERDYDLRTIGQLQSYVQEHKHLPGIPSAKEMTAKGLNLGEMQSKLLEKIEELTLYVIGLKKDNEGLREQIAAIEEAA